jgi:hypothetical protein
MKTVTITLTLTEKQAWKLAQCCKRFGYTQAEQLSDPTNKNEPYDMLEGISLVQAALRDQGIAPR